MDGSITISGDSGGPWYKYNTAWGIHLGLCDYGAEQTSRFTPARLISATLSGPSLSWSA
ncbi:hypothetical protein [Nonomuraea sp. NPDC049158]|uniref:hypothetical protein n=1 Tax=Nonomuraea sp. NPDC049158 TaxID=3155649 RepID=UPI0033D80ADE